VLSRAKDGLANFLVLLRERVVHDAQTALVLDRQTDKHCHSRQVSLHEIRGTIEWVDPDDSVLGVERIKTIDCNFILTVILPERVLDPVTPLVMLLVQEIGRYEALDRISERSWLHSTQHIGDALLRLFSLDAKRGVQRFEVNFKCLLNAEVSLRHGTILSFFLRLKLSRLLHLSDNFATLLRQVDTDGEELSNADVLMRLTDAWLLRINLSGR